ncbi:MAG: leucyl aminopeptidase family protein [Proteobacteria bacterium]|nr:leucyl aminopeptidase family protein [Pseudomonadota bacterium]
MEHLIKIANIEQAIRISVIKKADVKTWLKQQNSYLQNMAASQSFGKNYGQFLLDYNKHGKISRLYLILADDLSPYSINATIKKIPTAQYCIDSKDHALNEAVILGWGYGAYEFDAYKSNSKQYATLLIKDEKPYKTALSKIQATHLVRDLINTPADDMGPSELSEFTENMAADYGAVFSSIVGDDLLTENFPAIHVVGRASHKAPRLLEMTWGDEKNPTLVLVGKGVCFDTGGNNMKSSKFMKWMKKDMGGAAHVLGLAKMIMDYKMPVQLKVLIPAVENAVSANAYRQGDIITTRSGQTVEIGHTDAEGRVILSDTLTYACEFEPDLVIDYATLTGAARTAVGPNLAPLFCNDDNISAAVLQAGIETHDELWRMPLYRPYRKYIKPHNADLSNTGAIAQAGCITAALFLEHFIAKGIPWIHIDTYGWNFGDRTGGKEGGEALGVVAVFHCLQQRYKKL